MRKKKFFLQRVTNKINNIFTRILENAKHLLLKKKVYIGGYGHSKNFGDALNTSIVEVLSGQKVIHDMFIKSHKEQNVYYVIGSVLQWAKNDSTIWGAGFISRDSNLNSKTLSIKAVRGYLTKQKLYNYSDVSNVAIGDPALLMPLIYNNSINKKYRIGLIPHYVDKNNEWVKYLESTDEVKVIDVECGKKWRSFIDDVLSCEVIISSSLHGLIIADAYQVPSLWVSFSNDIEGGDFKFLDYYSSIGIKDIYPFKIRKDTELSEIVKQASLKKVSLDLIPLINSCPFILESKKTELLNKIVDGKK